VNVMTYVYTISELAEEFDISARTIRYYEEINLIHPNRTENGHRIYTRRDRARLRLILRGKRFGFSLEEIAEMITLFDKDRTGENQLEVTIQYGQKKLLEMEEKINDMVALKGEIEELLLDFQKRLNKIKEEKKNEFV